MNNLKLRIFHFLRWSEKYTKTDMVYVGKSGFWLVSNQIVGVVTAIILSAIFANLIPKETFGMYKYVLSMIGLVSAFSLTGINTAIVRAVAQGFDKIFKVAIINQIIWSTPRVVFGIILSIYYFSNTHTAYGFAFLFTAFLAPLASIANTYGPYLEGKKDFKSNAKYGIYSNLFHSFIMTIACFFYPSLIILVVSYYLSTLIAHFFFFYKTYKKHTPKNFHEREEDIKYAKELSVMNILGGIAAQIDNIIVYHFLGPVNLAIYTFATLIPEKIRSFFGIISSAALPKFSEKSTDISSGILRKVIILSILSLVIIIIYSAAAPYIFQLLFPEYIDSIKYSQLYSFSLLVIPAYITLPKLLANHKKRELYILSSLIPITKILLTLFAVLFFGVLGAILARILSYLLQIAISLFFVIE